MEPLRSLRFTAPALLSLAAVARGQLEEPVWPMANGSHDVLHGFQEPLRIPLGPGYPPYLILHYGVDLRGAVNGSQDEVVAMRSGVVRQILMHSNYPDNGLIAVVVQTPHGLETDTYVQVKLEPWLVGDTIHAGDLIGLVTPVWGVWSHLHISRWKGVRTGASTANPLHPLEMFISDADRDPGLLPARPEDANRDGVVFHVAPDGRPTIRLPYAFQAVELLFEASDRQSDSVAFGQVVQSVGYWVESRAGGDDVASAARPYRLMRFDDAWSRSCADCDLLFEDIWVNSPAYIVARSPQPWRTLATYRLTHAAGFDGLGSGVSPLQAWHTDARAGAGAPNGTGALEAREIQEARFPDGRHLVHALAGDIRAETDTVFEVVVDNFRPYVKAVRLLTEGGRELYRSAWTFDPDTSQLVLQRSDAVSALHAGDRLRLEVEFSEPMEGVKLLAITPALGPVPALTSTQAFDARTTWSGTLPVSVLPRRDGLAHLYISGQDLAGTTLYPFPSDAPITAPFNKRSDATPIVDPTVDSVHGIPLSPVPVERTPRSKLGD